MWLFKTLHTSIEDFKCFDCILQWNTSTLSQLPDKVKDNFKDHLNSVLLSLALLDSSLVNWTYHSLSWAWPSSAPACYQTHSKLTSQGHFEDTQGKVSFNPKWVFKYYVNSTYWINKRLKFLGANPILAPQNNF